MKWKCWYAHPPAHLDSRGERKPLVNIWSGWSLLALTPGALCLQEICNSSESDGVSRRLPFRRQATPGVPRRRSRTMDEGRCSSSSAVSASASSVPTAGMHRQLERVRCDLAAARQEVEAREELLESLQLEAQQQQDDDDDDAELVELEDYQARGRGPSLPLTL
jgi:hypothetical protein